jgi:hypothetical protein
MFYTLLYHDIIEITFYASCIFIFCKWLAQDKTKNLIIYFFTYSFLLLTAWTVQLPTVTYFLYTYAPVALLLFIVLHEKTLQRNLVTLCNLTPTHAQHNDWLETILSASLALINSHTAINVVIEHTDALDHFLTTPFFINADLEKNVLDILLSSASYDEHKIVWITTSGKIRGINATWLNDAFVYAVQHDALVFSTHPISRTFSIIINGKEHKNLPAHHVKVLIKKHLSLLTSSPHKGIYHENNAPENSLTR